jgi:hypothetical protein
MLPAGTIVVTGFTRVGTCPTNAIVAAPGTTVTLPSAAVPIHRRLGGWRHGGRKTWDI